MAFKSFAPYWAAAFCKGSPNSTPNAKHALITPEKNATQTPLPKLNSAIVSFFASSGSSRSFDIPAQLQEKTPNRQTANPPSEYRPEVSQNSPRNSPLKICGIRAVVGFCTQAHAKRHAQVSQRQPKGQVADSPAQPAEECQHDEGPRDGPENLAQCGNGQERSNQRTNDPDEVPPPGNFTVPPVLRGTATQASRGKRTGFPYTTAGFTLPDLDGYGLRHQALTRPALAPSYPVSVRRLVRLFHTSSRPHLAVTPLCFPSLHLHQVGGGTFTLLVSARARHAPSVEPKVRKNKTSAWRPKLRPQAASQMMFQLRPVPSRWIIQGGTLTEYEGDCAADRSLLGTWAHSADKSSRSRL